MSHPQKPSGVTKSRRDRQPKREIVPALWQHHYKEIRNLYLGTDDQESLQLEPLMAHFQQERLFAPTQKQWKSQLARWDLKKNLDVEAAAVVLHLHKDAIDKQIRRRIWFGEKEKTLEDIKTYVKKSKHIGSEEELLGKLPPADKWPDSVIWRDEGRSNTFAEPEETFSNPHVTLHAAYEQGGGMQPGDLQDVSQISAHDLHNGTLEPSWVMLPRNPTHENDSYELLPEAENAMNMDSNRDVWLPLSTNLDGTIPGAPFDMLRQEPAYVPLPNEIANGMDEFNRLMSATPIVPEFQHMSDEEQWEKDLPKHVEKMLGSRHGFDESTSIDFLRHCCKACIYLGQESRGGKASQGFAARRQNAVYSAAAAFHQVRAHLFHESLTTLNFMRVLLDAYGHRDMAKTILLHTLQTMDTFIDPLVRKNSVVADTLRFMIDMSDTATWNKEKAKLWVPNVSNIHNAAVETAGNGSELEIATLYNLAWTLLEAGEIQHGFTILTMNKTVCENVFGLYKLQTITWMSSLARAELFLQREDSAQATMEESVAPRMEKAFSKQHPLYWLTKYRQGLFLLRIAYQNRQKQRRTECWESGENILRQVLQWRARELGFNNPQTGEVATWLMYYLKKQGKKQDADDIDEWFQVGLEQQKEDT